MLPTTPKPSGNPYGAFTEGLASMLLPRGPRFHRRPEAFEVGVNEHSDQLFERGAGRPAKLVFGPGEVADVAELSRAASEGQIAAKASRQFGPMWSNGRARQLADAARDRSR
jgi:hypothetical protein